MPLLFLSSGLFLGWSLGANDAANVFGTAVSTKMLRFKTAALACSIFIIIGAVIDGGGATTTLGELGKVSAIAGSFMVALSAGFTVFWMTKLGLPVSTSQAIVGAIVGWNFFTGQATDWGTFAKILLTWVACPLISAGFAIILYHAVRFIIARLKMHLLVMDSFTRFALFIAGIFSSYSLGANNIANVMGVFVPVFPLDDLNVFGLFSLSSTQQLFMLGGLAISVGVLTYSQKVMQTIGMGLFKISPVAALIVVLSHSLTLFIFSSEWLKGLIVSTGLPALPLVPVSSSQAIVGAIIGIGIAKKSQNIKFAVLKDIAIGWIATPLVAGVISFISLFFLQNVFKQKVI